MQNFMHELIVELLIIVLVLLILLGLRRVLHRFWPRWLHPLDVLLPIIMFITSVQLGMLTVRPAFLWAVVVWLVIGLATSWRTFQGHTPVSYKKFVLLYWRISDLYWVGLFILAIILNIVF